MPKCYIKCLRVISINRLDRHLCHVPNITKNKLYLPNIQGAKKVRRHRSKVPRVLGKEMHFTKLRYSKIEGTMKIIQRTYGVLYQTDEKFNVEVDDPPLCRG